jgi:hypothetical protein
VTDEGDRAGARRPRWDPDDRGIGVGDARAHIDHLDRLRDAAATDGWVAEDPVKHLLPHLEGAVPAGSDWAIDATTDPDGTLVVDLRWTRHVGPDQQTVRAIAYALIGSVAEASTVIHQRPGAAGPEFDIVTGLLADDTEFATHGHTLRLRFTTPTSDESVAGQPT